MIFDYLQPVSLEIEKFVANLSNQTLGKRLYCIQKRTILILDTIAIALIFVNENRGCDQYYEADFLQLSEKPLSIIFLAIGIKVLLTLEMY